MPLEKGCLVFDFESVLSGGNQTPRPIAHWLVFLPRGRWGHVCVVSEYRDYWQQIECSWTGVQVTTLDAETGREALEACKRAVRVYRVAPQDEKGRSSLEIFSCVTLTKRVIGLKKWWIFTPRQLERWASQTV